MSLCARAKISAVIVTRGNVDLGRCLQTIHADEVIIRVGHGGVWERYEAALNATNEIVYTQDDDCVVEADRVIEAYDREKVTVNMPLSKRWEYPDQVGLVGWGAVFHRQAVELLFSWQRDELFRRECDRVFTGLNPLKLIETPFYHLPHAAGLDRMGAETRHAADLVEIRRRIYAVRGRG